MVERADQSPLETPSNGRLVIRVKLVPQEPPQPSGWQRWSRSPLLLSLGAVVAVLLSWLGISTFRSDPDVPPAAARTEESAIFGNERLSKPGTEASVPKSADALSVEPEVRQQPAAPPSSVNEVIPDVPRSALQTIRGTIRVIVRVNVDKQGAVIDAVAAERGPSRYFERLAVEAAKKWMFTPVTSEERRTMLVQFNFTRDGASAHASPQP